MNSAFPVARVRTAIDELVDWLARYGETSRDHQSFFASLLGRQVKALYYRRPLLGALAVAPVIACEALMPTARRLFWKPQRFAIADAHYAMGFAFLSRALDRPAAYERAVHFLDVLEQTRCRTYQHHAWGYPFDWQTRTGTIAAGTPLITTVPYVYEAFREVHALDKDDRWRVIMHSMAQHALLDYRQVDVALGVASTAYTPAPDDPAGVINASAYRAAMLFTAATDFADSGFADAAARNLAFVLKAQNPDGSWYYSIDGQRDFVDHFHTCFVLKALARIEGLIDDPRVTEAIDRGLAYYVTHLFDERGLPKPFSRAPRLTVYRRELYDYAECINLAIVLRGRSPALDSTLTNVIDDLLTRWHKPDGSFRSRELFLGWDNVPMHRWAQAQLFRSLALLLRTVSESS